MTPGVVVDIGNSFMKWSRAAGQSVSLSLDNEQEWESVAWGNVEPWLIASVVPKATTRLTEWLQKKQRSFAILDNVIFLKSAAGFRTEVEEPLRVGIDRLVNAYAAHCKSDGLAAAVISVGTAMTLDYVDAGGTHRGGAILPGPDLMARSLNDYTAKLPKVEVGRYQPETLFGTGTEQAIHLGITRAAVKAADSLIADWASEMPLNIFLTGGGHKLFRDYLFSGNWNEVITEPTLTLEGLWAIAGSLP